MLSAALQIDLTLNREMETILALLINTYSWQNRLGFAMGKIGDKSISRELFCLTTPYTKLPTRSNRCCCLVEHTHVYITYHEYTLICIANCYTLICIALSVKALSICITILYRFSYLFACYDDLDEYCI